MTRFQHFFKNFFFFLMFSLIASSSFAGIKSTVLPPRTIKTTEVDTSKKCSTMILVNGREISCFIEEVGIEVVKYRKCDNLTGPVYVMYKKDISLVKHANGTTEFIKVEETKRGSSSSYSSNNDSERTLNVPAFLGFLLSLISLILPVTAGIVGEALALIFSIIGLTAIGQDPDRFKGKGFAIAGLIISGVLLFILAMRYLF